MSASPETPVKTTVTLLRLGVGKEEIELTEGATLADLLRTVEASVQNAEILIDGKTLDECLILRPGVIISVGQKARSAETSRSWGDTVGMFRDDPLFEEALQEGRAYRENLR